MDISKKDFNHHLINVYITEMIQLVNTEALLITLYIAG